MQPRELGLVGPRRARRRLGEMRPLGNHPVEDTCAGTGDVVEPMRVG